MKELFLSPVGSCSQRVETMESLANRVKAGREQSFILVLPSSHLLHQARRELVSGATRDLNVLTFDELAQRFGIARGVDSLDSLSRRQVFTGVVNAVSPGFEYLPTHPSAGLARSLLDAIVFLRRSNVNQSRLAQVIEREPTPLLRDLTLIYRAYSRFLQDRNLVDIEESYFNALRSLEVDRHPWLEQIELLVVDQFFDFEPIQMGLLSRISGVVDSVRILMPFSHPEPYSLVIKTIRRLEALGFVTKEQSGHSQEGQLGHLSSQLFVPGAPRLSGNCVLELAATSINQELDLVAEQIKNMVRSGTTPSDICLVVPDQIKYMPVLRTKMYQHQIELSMPMRVELKKIPWIRELLTVWEAAANQESSSLINIIKFRYLLHFLPPSADSAAAELVIHRYGDSTWHRLPRVLDREISRLEHLAAECSDEWERTQYLEPLQLLLAGRPAIWAVISVLKKWFPGGAKQKYTPAQHCSLLRALVHKNLALISPLGEELRDQRDRVSYLKLQQIISSYLQCCSLQESAELSPRLFLHDFEPWLDQPLDLEQPSPGAIQVFSPTQARGLKFAGVFVLGLNQGVFPRHSETNWLLEGREFSWLCDELKLGLEDYLADFQREKLFFHNCIAAARERLFLSRLLPDAHGEGGESCLLGSVRSLTGPLAVITATAPAPSLDRATNLRQLSARLFYDLSRGLQSELHTSAWTQLQEQPWLDGIIDGIEMESARNASTPPGNWDGVLSSSQALLAKRFARGIWSVSRIEQYIRCPYAFYARYVLGMAAIPGQRPAYGPLERGSLLHQLLDKFYSRHVVSGQFPVDIPGVITELARESAAEAGWDWESSLWRLRLREAVDLLAQLVWEDCQWRQISGMRPVLLEADFGFHNSSVGPVSLAGVNFHGRIDRIDILETEAECWAAVYDYKSSGATTAKSILAGESFQIPVYLAAVKPLLAQLGYKNIRLAGGGYYTIKDGKRSGGIWDPEFCAISGNALSPLELGSLDDLLAKLSQVAQAHLGRIMAGWFAPASSWQCRYCDYVSCCRYEKNRFKLKGGAEDESRQT